MATFRNTLIETARSFVNSLPKEVAEQTATSVQYQYELGGEETGSLFLSSEQVESYMICAERLRQAVEPNFDTKSVEKLLEQVVLGAVDPQKKQVGVSYPKRKSAALEALANALTAPPSHYDVYIGVQNISSQGLPQTVGRVRFLALNHAGVASIMAGYDEVASISPDPSSVKAAMRKHLSELLTEKGISTAACVTARANTEVAAKASALRELRRTLGVLNFYAYLIHVQPTIVYLPGEAVSTTQFVFSYRHDEDEAGATSFGAGNYTSELAGIWSAMGLFDPYLHDAREQGFDRACELLSREAPNPVENRILTAIHWAGRAAASNAVRAKYQEKLDSEREEGFLFYAICLESLFVKRGERNDITARLSTRCARLLGAGSSNREAIRKSVAKLYDRRSDIVHEGNTLVTDEEMRHIRHYACASIITMLQSEEFSAMTNEAAFENWFEARATE